MDSFSELFLTYGTLNTCSDLLRLLISTGTAVKDPAAVADELLDAFGDAFGVLSASVEQLQSFGLTRRAATLISLTSQLAVKSCKEHFDRTEAFTFKNSGDIGKRLSFDFFGCKDERFMLYCLDASLREIRSFCVADGCVNKVNVDIRRIAELALSTKCTSCIIAHNHPDGMAEPSREDILVTEKIVGTLPLLGIKCVDHFILTSDGHAYYSFAEHDQI